MTICTFLQEEVSLLGLQMLSSYRNSRYVLGSDTEPLFGGGVDVNGIRAEALAYMINAEYLYNYTIGYKYSF